MKSDDPQNLSITTKVNGEIRQSSNTGLNDFHDSDDYLDLV